MILSCTPCSIFNPCIQIIECKGSTALITILSQAPSVISGRGRLAGAEVTRINPPPNGMHFWDDDQHFQFLDSPTPCPTTKKKIIGAVHCTPYGYDIHHRAHLLKACLEGRWLYESAVRIPVRTIWDADAVSYACPHIRPSITSFIFRVHYPRFSC